MVHVKTLRRVTNTFLGNRIQVWIIGLPEDKELKQLLDSFNYNSTSEDLRILQLGPTMNDCFTQLKYFDSLKSFSRELQLVLIVNLFVTVPGSPSSLFKRFVYNSRVKTLSDKKDQIKREMLK